MSAPYPRYRMAAACVFVAAFWTVLAFAVFSPDAPCGDCSVKYVQAQSLIMSGFRSMALAYPGEAFDGNRKFFPLRPPFTLQTAGGGVQTIWSPVVMLSQAPFLLAGGLAGIVVLSLVSGLFILWMSARIGGREEDWALPLILGFGTCLWYYAIQPWEHAPAVALVLASIWAASRRRPRAALAAGLLLGVASVIRDESLLLLPAVLLLSWNTKRRFVDLFVTCAAAGGVIVAAGLFDTFVYGRPPAAHALQHVGPLRAALSRAGLVQDVATIARMSFSDRYDTVVHYWLVSSVSHRTLAVFAIAVAVACATARWARSWVGILLVAVATLAWSVFTLWPLIGAPRSVPALFTLSPFLVFACLPVPSLDDGLRRRRWLLVAGAAACVGLALFTTDTAGGKSLGPRLMLTIMPLLTIAAWQAIAGYMAAGRERLVWRLIGWTGVALVVTSVGINGCVMFAYAGRNRMDYASVDAVRRAPARVVVTDNLYTAQAFMPLYFTKVLFLADSPESARDLAALLSRARVGSILLVSREAPRISLEPYRMVASSGVGRVTLQDWTR